MLWHKRGQAQDRLSTGGRREALQRDMQVQPVSSCQCDARSAGSLLQPGRPCMAAAARGRAPARVLRPASVHQAGGRDRCWRCRGGRGPACQDSRVDAPRAQVLVALAALLQAGVAAIVALPAAYRPRLGRPLRMPLARLAPARRRSCRCRCSGRLLCWQLHSPACQLWQRSQVVQSAAGSCQTGWVHSLPLPLQAAHAAHMCSSCMDMSTDIMQLEGGLRCCTGHCRTLGSVCSLHSLCQGACACVGSLRACSSRSRNGGRLRRSAWLGAGALLGMLHAQRLPMHAHAPWQKAGDQDLASWPAKALQQRRQ